MQVEEREKGREINRTALLIPAKWRILGLVFVDAHVVPVPDKQERPFFPTTFFFLEPRPSLTGPMHTKFFFFVRGRAIKYPWTLIFLFTKRRTQDEKKKKKKARDEKDNNVGSGGRW
jgi:hypothetical protein